MVARLWRAACYFTLASSVSKPLASCSRCLTARLLSVLCLVDGCFFYDWFEAESRNMAEPAPERYTGAPTFSRRRGRLSECSPCRYSGRAICRYYVSVGLLLSAFLWKRRAGTAFLLFFCKKRDSRGAVTRGRGYQGLAGCSG